MTSISEWPVRTSYWIGEDVPREAPLEGVTTCDVVVVGGGFAGLSTALHVKRGDPGAAVVLVEAELCGAGASGKNQGIPAVMSPDAAGRLCATLDADAVKRFTARQVRVMEEYEAFIAEHRIDCDFRRSKAAWIVTTPAQLEYQHRLTKNYGAGDLPFRTMSADEASATLARPALGGIELGERTRADFNPFKFVSALKRLALEAGVVIYESTPAEAVEPGPPATVRTPAGEVRAEQAVIATNAYSDAFALSKGLQSNAWAYQIVTEPIGPAAWDQMGWSGEHVLINEIDPTLEWQAYRFMDDGRLFWSIGGEMFRQPDGTVLDNANTAAYEYVWGQLVDRFPFLADVKVESAHGAALDMSPVFYPTVGRFSAARNVLVAVGFSGFGIVPSWNSGRILAGHLLGPDRIVEVDEEWRLALLRMNPVARQRVV